MNMYLNFTKKKGIFVCKCMYALFQFEQFLAMINGVIFSIFFKENIPFNS